MKSQLKRRLDALEGKRGGSDRGVVVWIQRTLVGFEEESPTRARIGLVCLLRAPGEAEITFLERTRVEALRQPSEGPGRTRVVTLDADG